MKLALFSTYSTTNSFSKNVIIYLKELTTYFDKVVVLSNNNRVNIKSSHINFLNDYNIELILLDNFGYDFGMYYKYIQHTDIKMNEVNQLGLFNDSCTIIGSLHPFFEWFNTKKLDYGGITDSAEFSYHIQSYALMLNNTIVNTFIEYLTNTLITNDKTQIIQDFEIGFCKYISTKLYNIKALYNNEEYNAQQNMSWESYIKLMNDKCPLIKNSVIKHNNVNRSAIKKQIKTYQFDALQYVKL